MKQFSQLVFISTLLTKTKTGSMAVPGWLKHFLINLNNDRYYEGSVLYRYIWNGNYYFQLEVPSETKIFMHLINQRGEFLKWTNNRLQQFVNERSEETVVWEYFE